MICEFLDSVGDVSPLFPRHGLRLRALRFQAMAGGIMDAAVLRRREQGESRGATRDADIARQARKVALALATLEHDTPAALGWRRGTRA